MEDSENRDENRFEGGGGWRGIGEGCPIECRGYYEATEACLDGTPGGERRRGSGASSLCMAGETSCEDVGGGKNILPCLSGRTSPWHPHGILRASIGHP